MDNQVIGNFEDRKQRLEHLVRRVQDIARTLPLRDQSLFRPEFDALSRQLESPLNLLLLGELNVGKSSIFNALTQEGASPVGVMSKTDSYIVAPCAHLELIDAPGFDSDIPELPDLELKARFADAIIYVVSAERSMSLSDREFISGLINDWRRRVIVVLNKTDLCSLHESRALCEQIRSSLPSTGVISIVETSNRIPETLSSLKRELMNTFSVRIAQEAKLISLADIITTLCEDMCLALEREKFSGQLALEDISRQSMLHLKQVRNAQSSLGPGINEIEIFEGIARECNKIVIEKWSVTGAAFGKLFVTRGLKKEILSLIKRSKAALSHSYTNELPTALATWVQDYADEMQIDARQKQGNLRPDSESLKDIEQRILAKVGFRSALLNMIILLSGALFAGALFYLYPFTPVDASFASGCAAILIVVNLLASWALRNSVLSEISSLVQTAQNSFIRDMHDFVAKELSRFHEDTKIRIAGSQQDSNEALEAIGKAHAALSEISESAQDCRYNHALRMTRKVIGEQG